MCACICVYACVCNSYCDSGSCWESRYFILCKKQQGVTRQIGLNLMILHIQTHLGSPNSLTVTALPLKEFCKVLLVTVNI